MTHAVFIRLASKDHTIANTLISALEASKIRCWIAPRDNPTGQVFADLIIKAIITCKAFVMIWSALANTSEQVLIEINQAFDLSRF